MNQKKNICDQIGSKNRYLNLTFRKHTRIKETHKTGIFEKIKQKFIFTFAILCISFYLFSLSSQSRPPSPARRTSPSPLPCSSTKLHKLGKRMNFFQSILNDDPDPNPNPHQTTSNPESTSSSLNPTQTQTHQTTTSSDEEEEHPGSDPHSNPTTQSPSWSFGRLIKTLQVISEWIDTYKRALEEFGSGLKKETKVFREVASGAVKDLPTSIKINASKAQVSLESVRQAFAEILLADLSGVRGEGGDGGRAGEGRGGREQRGNKTK